ncbi:MAG: hypothetical protein RLZZ535_3748 [Cyanobacteriota bacterium]
MSLLNGHNDGAGAREVLDFCLSNESPELRAKVYEIIGRSGLDPSDPMFLVLALTGQMRVFLEAAPADLNQLLSEWKQESASSLFEITEAIANLKQTSLDQAEAIRANMEAVSQKYIASMKQVGMDSTSAIADANSETLEQVGQTERQIEQLLAKLTALQVNINADEQKSIKSKQAFVEWVSKTTRELNEIRQKLDRSHSAIERLQLNTFWLKWAEWVSPLFALTIVGSAGLLAGGWLTYQNYNSYVDELGRDLMGWNLDRLVECQEDKNPKCTFWIVPPDSPQREGVE